VKKDKEKEKENKTSQAAIEPRTSSLSDKIWPQFSHGDGHPTVTRRL
jgi:hypothetical protein